MKNLSEIHIVTQRLKLTPVSRADWRSFHKLYGNASVMKLFDSGRINTEEETKKLVEDFARRRERGDLLAPLVIWNEKNQFVGFVNLRYEPCKQPGHVELGYMILEEHWNKGYANEAAQAAMIYLQNLSEKGYKIGNVALCAVVATAHPDNPASSRVLEKLNMTCVGSADRQGYPRRFYLKSLNDSIKDLHFLPEDLFVSVTQAVSNPKLIRSKL